MSPTTPPGSGGSKASKSRTGWIQLASFSAQEKTAQSAKEKPALRFPGKQMALRIRIPNKFKKK
ncbi:MAG: hypothetical protein JW747_04565, partial [Candidatus Aminicenantes bacterium]|nr:hypothetical protein [Candidatus Aminicenantes bacterium]